MRPQHVDLPPHAAPPIVVRAGVRPIAVHGAGQHATWLEPGQGGMFVWHERHGWYCVGEEF
jgi:hypothetical protein